MKPFMYLKRSFLTKNEDGDELLHDDKWALKEEDPVHDKELPSDISNHYDGGNDHHDKRAKTGGPTISWHEIIVQVRYVVICDTAILL